LNLAWNVLWAFNDKAKRKDDVLSIEVSNTIVKFSTNNICMNPKMKKVVKRYLG
jgi:hypothetical protein